MVPLKDLNEGESGEIVEIAEPEFCPKKRSFFGRRGRRCCRCNDIGLRKGKVVQILRKHKSGPMLLKVDQTRIAIDQGVVESIRIKNLP